MVFISSPRFPAFLLCLAIAAFSTYLPNAAAQTPAVIINEINYAPDGTNNPAEFVELYNNSATNVDVSGWKFDAGIDYTFPAATAIPAQGYLVVSGDPGKFATRWGFTPLGPFTGKLSNEGEQIRLRDAGNNTVDAVVYSPGFPWPTAAAGDGSSMELINPAFDNALPGSWRSSGQPSVKGSPQVYLPPNDVSWRFRKGTSEASTPVSAWRELDFVEDGTWATEQTSIGYGDNDDVTVLNDMRNNYSSLFLRRTFEMPPNEMPAALKVKARVDDGCIIWINGHEVARFHVAGNLVPTYNSFAQSHDASVVTFESTNLLNASSLLIEGENIIAVQAFNSSRDSTDFTIDVALEELQLPATGAPTPGAVNSCSALNAPPSFGEVWHSPLEPVGGQAVTIATRVTDPDGVAAVMLKYQLVNPGSYIRNKSAIFTNSWSTVPMYDDGTNGDTNAGDFIYTAVLAGTTQTHRRLVRYKITAEDGGARSIEVPYIDDGSPNFAYLVYNGMPNWIGAFRPGVTPAVTYSSNVLQSLPVYQLIAAQTDVTNSQYASSFNDRRFYGTLVYNGRVYDHIQFHNRGEASTYVAGKNKWRIHFNTAREFHALDNWGRPYIEPWDELNLNACASPWCAVHRGMSGVEEAVSYRFYELSGMASPQTHFLHFRVIDDASETGATQFQGGNPNVTGDLWGLYLAVEQPDGSFLDERELPDGNVYKIQNNNGDMKHQGDEQVTDGSDWVTFRDASTVSQTENWWRTNLNLEAFYNFHAANHYLGNIDLRQGYNYYYYHQPDGRWRVIPWDLDMVFIPKAHLGGIIDQVNSLLRSALRIEFQNRGREILDLMGDDASANGGQIGQLIDEYARMLAPAGTTTNWATLDAAMWNMNPRTRANASNPQINHRGSYYVTPYNDNRLGGSWVRTLATSNFAGSMKYLLDYATDTFPTNLTWVWNNGDQRGYGYEYLRKETTDNAIPQRPVANHLGEAAFPINDLRFNASVYAGANPFMAAQWRVGEISAPGVPLYDATRPHIYEITDVWRSAELPSNGVVTIPSGVIEPGRTYRARVRHKDVAGRWSRWSDAIQFVPTLAVGGITSNDVVISEMMYNPPASTPAEISTGYSDKQLFEFVELLNISTNSLDLEGLAFTAGIGFAFKPGETLASGGRILLAKSTNAFALRYGAAGHVAGEYTGNLDNAGEHLALTFAGRPVHDFSYSDGSHPVGSDSWPPSPDGTGPSLVLMNPQHAPDHGLFSNWRPSSNTNGSPGSPDPIIYAEWSLRHPGLGLPQDDDDADGASNEAEYFFGTSPHAANSVPAPVSGAMELLNINGETNSYFVFSFTRSAENGDVNYLVEFSTDLEIWPGRGVLVDAINHSDGTRTERWRCEDTVIVPQHVFARLRAQFK